MSPRRRLPSEPPGPTEREKIEVLAILRRASEPIERRELAFLASLHERVARKAVAALVLDGEPIVTLNDGYRLCHDPAIIRAEVRSLRHRATAVLRRADALEAWLDGSPQRDLFEELAR